MTQELTAIEIPTATKALTWKASSSDEYSLELALSYVGDKCGDVFDFLGTVGTDPVVVTFYIEPESKKGRKPLHSVRARLAKASTKPASPDAHQRVDLVVKATASEPDDISAIAVLTIASGDGAFHTAMRIAEPRLPIS